MALRIFALLAACCYAACFVLVLVANLEADMLEQTYSENCTADKGFPKVTNIAKLGMFDACIEQKVGDGTTGEQCGKLDSSCNPEGVTLVQSNMCDDQSMKAFENAGGIYPYSELCQIHQGITYPMMLGLAAAAVCCGLQLVSMINICAKILDCVTGIIGQIGGICVGIPIIFFGIIPAMAENLGAGSIGDYASFTYAQGAMFYLAVVGLICFYAGNFLVCCCGCCCRKPV
uniref:Uncharacterized protein n=1 Tax=Chromera velia CCMP2878 TaxID=1169474 RepID=A0A0G4FRV4_9ALVE|mmetsp:Transcript_41110/g.81096  ORF Transcript_41110/g.81096 Transcript_41110/m.81096 type:complete len:231 (-) Transcript_41110:484-1176(-)|eukprot:Cvel_18454.t1-p1 / transcript=Cvel_18454.t1 / gene=Cvel_18454 / organism=Chromera_velia_CCMP2878 / gene_product=hypothetical protein / transcript_product=hypothetical protein / location=Cvel_scaffold1529:1928-5438(-) / protein_length=230 / sequence_SO=supercontig / SO=protein_coding / is_pseudo=false